MNRTVDRTVGIAILLLSACTSSAPLERVEVPPAAPVSRQVAPNAPSTTDEAATQRWLEDEANRRRGTVQTGAPMEQPAQPAQEPAPREPAPREPAPQEPAPQQPAPQQPDQGHGGLAPRHATQQELNEEATRAWFDRTIEMRRAANPDAPPVPMQETVYVDRPIYYQGQPVNGYDAYGQPVYQPQCAQPYSTFPLGTLVGAGVGAAIGHQSHHQSEGAWIGAGVGLLLDVFHHY